MKLARPPAWATAWLETLVPARDHATIAGDLLEEYREFVLPSRGVLLANFWYLTQVSGFMLEAEWLPFALRTCIVWSLLFTAAALLAPVGGVAAFLIGIPWCGFAVARRSILMWTGTAAALIAAGAMFAIFDTLQFQHPPSLVTPIFAAVFLSVLAAFIGRCTSEHIQEIVFPRFTAN